MRIIWRDKEQERQGKEIDRQIDRQSQREKKKSERETEEERGRGGEREREKDIKPSLDDLGVCVMVMMPTRTSFHLQRLINNNSKEKKSQLASAKSNM